MRLQNRIVHPKIEDKQGNVYIVNIVSEDETVFSAYISFKKICVGRINWVIEENNVMTLADLVIFDGMVRRPLWSRLLPFLTWKPPNFKQRGLGSAMLRYVIAQAEKLQVDAISGYLTSDDLRDTPYLPEFYEKHGFLVRQSAPDSAPIIYRDMCQSLER
jgi:hypothetical protein